MLRAIARRARAGEEGAAMVIAVTLSAVVATLSLLMVTVGIHADKATARGRHHTQALHVAESGIEEALALIEERGAAMPDTNFTGETEVGDYSVTIDRQTRNRYLVTSTGGVRAGRELGSERTIRVLLEPPSAFKKALFSSTTVETKNGDIIEGDVWANHNVILAQNTVVTGSVVAASGYVATGLGVEVNGNITSGGYDPAVNQAITIGGNATVGGDVTAAVVPVNCVGADNSRYKIDLAGGAVVGGNARTWGTVQGSGTVLGTVSTTSCVPADATEELPAFTFSGSNYPSVEYFGTPTTASATAVADFQAYLVARGNRIQGTFYVNQSGSANQTVRLDLTGVTITGDTTIVTNTPVFANGVTDDTTDAIFVLVSTYDPPAGTACDVNNDNSECAIHVKNNFQTAGVTASVIYAPYGPVAIKNNQVAFGAIYSDSIQVKNNQTMTYDARVERVVGFGEVTLEPTEWQEVPTP